MMRRLDSLLFGLTLAVGAQAQATVEGPGSPTALSDCGSFQKNEPIVVWDVTGATLMGSVHASLVVYNSGVASVASARTGDVRTAFVGQLVAGRLHEDLVHAGAAALCDQSVVTSDVPLTTLTVLGDGTDVRAHSFSYWSAEAEYAAVQATIDDFLATHFSGFSVY
jgi:hypothetical protein